MLTRLEVLYRDSDTALHRFRVAIQDATGQFVTLYQGPSQVLAKESHRYAVRFVRNNPEATLDDVIVTFHTAQ